MLTICYITGRKEPCFDWFCESLHRETAGNYEGIRVVKVDFFAQPGDDWTINDVQVRAATHGKMVRCPQYFATPPKPTAWQGPHRLTKANYFAPSNARNTALCYAYDGFIAYVDDLSILMPGWLGAVREAMKGNYIACGAFRKVLNLEYREGVVTFFDHPSGHDSRWNNGDDSKAVDCYPNWLFGCSLVAPVNAFLKINGWPEAGDSTGVGGEDCFTGMALASTGHKLKYDRRMFTLESEERHFLDKPMLRIDKGKIGTPDSKSHALVRMLTGAKRFDNDFGDFPDLAALRQHVLKGGKFPVIGRPEHDWYDSQPVNEL